MMPRIDFYVLPYSSEETRLAWACRLIEKAYKHQHRIYIHALDQIMAHTLDEKLWTYRDDSFLPHNLYGEGPDPAPPIQIGFQSTPEKHRDILMNLCLDVPPFYRQFSRVLELVTEAPLVQTTAREHYRFYQAAGHTIQTHKIQTIEA